MLAIALSAFAEGVEFRLGGIAAGGVALALDLRVVENGLDSLPHASPGLRRFCRDGGSNHRADVLDLDCVKRESAEHRIGLFDERIEKDRAGVFVFPGRRMIPEIGVGRLAERYRGGGARLREIVGLLSFARLDRIVTFVAFGRERPRLFAPSASETSASGPRPISRRLPSIR